MELARIETAVAEGQAEAATAEAVVGAAAEAAGPLPPLPWSSRCVCR